MYGTCPFCRKSVQLIYTSPESKGRLVVGPHDVLPTVAVSISKKPDQCPGAREEPAKDEVAQE